MMFSGGLFAIAGAVLAVAVNGSPAEVAKRELQAARSLCIPPDVAERSK
jgi:ATP-dependent protease HslVU (ClpYQ) peptidase subunit